VHNPSTITDLTITLRSKVKVNGTSRTFDVGLTLAVPKNTRKFFVVSDWLVGEEGGEIGVSNDTILGMSDGFDTDLEVMVP